MSEDSLLELGSIENARPQAPAENSELVLAVEPEKKLDQQLTMLGEWMSPILVKEARQALKSRQFFWTFLLLLVAAAGWSMLGFALSQAASDSEMAGPRLLTGYWAILGVPLAIVIPFSVFRSLASEFENDTIQLVSITTMKPYQIILGKLGGAMLQMLVFFSVLAPCICFTYLLRGVDLVQILFGLMLAFFGSLGLCAVGLFLAGATYNNVMRIGLSVVFMFGLFMSYTGFTSFMTEIHSGFGPDFEYLSGILMGVSAAFFAVGFLAFSASSSQISFPADNRSTLNRIAMLLVNIVLVGLFGLAFTIDVDKHIVWFCSLFSFHLWLIFGYMMIGESPFMSPRVRRQLPGSFLGSAFSALLYPGPGRGYLFAMVNIWGWAIVLIVFSFSGEYFYVLSQSVGFGAGGWSKTLAGFSVFWNAVYASFFLSLAYCVVLVMRKNRKVTYPGGSLIIGVVLTGMLITASTILHYSLVSQQFVDSYSGWQLLNWYWSSYIWLDSGWNGANVVGSILLAIFTASLACICGLEAGKELLRGKVTVPTRVQQDIEEQSSNHDSSEETFDSIIADRKQKRADED